MVQNSNPLENILHADVQLSARAANCWSAQLISGFDGLQRGSSFDEGSAKHTDCSAVRHVSMWQRVARLDPCVVNRLALFFPELGLFSLGDCLIDEPGIFVWPLQLPGVSVFRGILLAWWQLLRHAKYTTDYGYQEQNT